MLIFLTNRCKMGCTHCLSSCVSDGEDMSFPTFTDALHFSLTRAYPTPVMLSGGEPTENPAFAQMVGYAIQEIRSMEAAVPLFILSNGEWLSQNTAFLDSLEALNLSWLNVQVVIDDRYYPRHVDEAVLKRYSCVKVCYGINQLYPQGRARVNGYPWVSKASKCFNVRAAVKQIHPASLEELVIRYSLPYAKYCSPNIDMNGSIRLGESFHCPVCSNIYKSDAEILDDIIRFQCSGCSFINDHLDEKYRQFL